MAKRARELWAHRHADSSNVFANACDDEVEGASGAQRFEPRSISYAPMEKHAKTKLEQQILIWARLLPSWLVDQGFYASLQIMGTNFG